MRRMVLLVGAVAVVASVVAGSAVRGQAHASSSALTSSEALAPADSTSFGGRILELKADAGRAIVVVSPTDSSPDDFCADVFVWRPSGGKPVGVFDHETCVEMFGSLGASFGVAMAGNNAAWVQSSGGNIYDTEMFAMSLATGVRRRIGVDAAGNQGYSGWFVVNPHGDGALLVYNRYSRCGTSEGADVLCPPGYKDRSISSDQIVMARPYRRTVATSGRALTVLAVGRGRIVARQAAGPLIVLAPRRAAAPTVAHAGFSAEHLIATYPYKPGEVRAAATDGRTLAVLRAGVLDVIPLPGSTGTHTTRSLPRAASYGADRPVACLEGPVVLASCNNPQLRLVDLDGNTAVFLYRNAVYLLNLTTGRTVILARPAARPVNAQLEPDGLYIAAGNTLTFTPRDQVEQRLHR